MSIFNFIFLAILLLVVPQTPSLDGGAGKTPGVGSPSLALMLGPQRAPYNGTGFSHQVMSDSLGPHGLQPARLLCPWDSPGENTGVGGHFLLQWIFPTQESNLGLLHCKQMIY